MGRRGPQPDYAKREAYMQAFAEGYSNAQAARIAGIHPRTGTAWRNGCKKFHVRGVLQLAPITVEAPKVKTYSPRYLSQEERIKLADLRQEHRTLREIAVLLGRSASTISRELRRGMDASGRYRPFNAHRMAHERRRVPRASRLSLDQELRAWVEGKLAAHWSPQQISHQLRREFREQPERWLCTETIYQAVYRADLGGLSRELPGHVLRRRRRQRKPHRDARTRRPRPIVKGVTIRDRPIEVRDRAEAGHWEGDLIVGKGQGSAIVTLVERTSRYTLLGHLPGGRHDSATVRDAVINALKVMPGHLRRTLTWDQGTEMARHPEITTALNTRVFFADAHSPWQRPTNEHTNGMLRAYFPKGTDLSVHTATDLADVQAEMNRRPRGILGWQTPSEHLATLIKPPTVLRR